MLTSGAGFGSTSGVESESCVLSASAFEGSLCDFPPEMPSLFLILARKDLVGLVLALS